MSKKFTVGDVVFALWPGSNKYYEATVLSIGKSTVEVNFKDGFRTELPHRKVFKEGRFRSRSSSPARSPTRRRTRSPARPRSRSRSRSPARNRGGPPSPKSSKETLIQQETQQTSATPTRRSARRGRTLERKIEESPSTTSTTSAKVILESSTVTTQRVTRSVAKKLIAEEKEAVLTTIKDDEPTKSSQGYEFGGPVGVFVMMVVLPAVVVGSYLFCNKESCSFREVPSLPPLWGFKGAFFDVGHLIVDGWIIFQAFIYMLPIGEVVQGQVLADGTALDYRMNGFLALMFSVIGFAACVYFKVGVGLVYDTFLGITTATICWSFFIALVVYIKARVQKTGLSAEGNTGNFIYDFFLGHQLNPRWGKFDFKFFFESRPGLIGWVMINFCMAAKEYQENGLSVAMVLVCMFQFLYVADGMLHESSMLSTLDMLNSGFGFKLAFGGISFIPILYSLQARYLVDHPSTLSNVHTTAIVILFVVGFTIYRGSNSQKCRFRENPLSEEFQGAETILTPSGKRLLASGWWGLVRHPNYLGDIIMALAWTLPCGFSHAIPFFYPVFVIVLLVERELRDERNSRLKYGATWDEYCQRVPYRILPKIF